MPTEDGNRLKNLLLQKEVEENEEADRRLVQDAERWGKERVARLYLECEKTALRTPIEIINLSGMIPSRLETLRLAVVSRLLGIKLNDIPVTKAMYADGPGVQPYVISLTLKELLERFKKI